MACKLDLAIAQVAVALGQGGNVGMLTAAAAAAPQLTAKDLDKLPDRWAPAFSAKKAGEPELGDSWDVLWFEALAELLVQRKLEGLPGLLILAERDDSTYHQFVLVRLLRLAADGLEKDEILQRFRKRLATLHYVKTRESVREIVYWQQIDSRPLELLKSMAEIVVPNSDGDTVGTYIAQMELELPVHLARMKTQGQ